MPLIIHFFVVKMNYFTQWCKIITKNERTRRSESIEKKIRK